MWTAVTGSATVFINGKPAHRQGDMDLHCGGMGKLIEGSPDVFCGGPETTTAATAGLLLKAAAATFFRAVFAGVDTPPTGPLHLDGFFKKLGFDPSGPSQNGHALLHPIDAWKARDLSEDALSAARAEYPNMAQGNTVADAYRHAYWNYRMTEELGADRAKGFGDAHERFSENEPAQAAMDLYNNDVGRRLASDPANKGRDPRTVIQEAIRSGKLQTEPFEIVGDPRSIPELHY